MVDRGQMAIPVTPVSTQSSEARNASPWFWIFGVSAGCYNDQHLSHFLVCRLQSSGDWLKHRGLGWGTWYKGLGMACPYSADYTTSNSKNPNTNLQTMTTSKGQERMQFGTTKNLGNGCQGFSQGQGYFEVGGSCAGRHSFLEAVVCVYLQKKPHSATPHLGARSMPCIQIRTCPLSRRLAGFSTRSLTELPHRKFAPSPR